MGSCLQRHKSEESQEMCSGVSLCRKGLVDAEQDPGGTKGRMVTNWRTACVTAARTTS